MAEFRYGDRVKVGNTEFFGTVVDERLPQNKPMGSFQLSLPHPVAVLWDSTNRVWWEKGDNLELA